MAPTKGKEKKAKPASSKEAVKKPTSKHEMQQQLERKLASLERAAAVYDKASPEKKRQIDGMRNEVSALRAVVDSMDVDDDSLTPLGKVEGKVEEPNTQPATEGLMENGGATPDNKSMERTHGNESGLSLTGSSPDNGSTSPGKDDDSSKTPGNPGGDGNNEPGHEKGAVNEGGQQQKPETGRAAPRQTVVQSIENDEPNGSLFLEDDETSEFEDPEYEDPEYGKPLLTIPTTSGISEEGVKTVGWSGRHLPKYINMYGKKYSATYRVENRAFPRSYAEDRPENENVGSAKNRFGDTLPGIGRVQHPNAETPRIWGVAWRGLNSGDLEHDLELIDPEYNDSFTHTVTYVLVGWMIDGEEEKKRETRTAYRNIIGNRSKADMNTYKAAVESQQRYIEAKEGRRRAISRSPSVPLLEGELDLARGKTRSARRTSKSSRSKRGSAQSDRGSSPTRFLPSPRSTVSPQRQTQGAGNLSEVKTRFLTDWLELRDAEDFSELSAADQQQCVESWRIHKKSVAAAA